MAPLPFNRFGLASTINSLCGDLSLTLTNEHRPHPNSTINAGVLQGRICVELQRLACYHYSIMSDRPDFPTMAQVENASREELAKWYRFLPSGDTDEQQRIMDRIAERFEVLGGMDAVLSKQIGF
jgi:hypothetical protein